jgi:DNA polymerase-3 subunit alpha
LDVNHIEGNRRTNNNVDNLCFLCPNHHRLYSEGKIDKEDLIKKRENYKLPKVKHMMWAEYIGKEYAGLKDVYDIETESPHNNYIASNVLVHNCNDERGVSMTEIYCRRKNKEEEITSFHPVVDEVLKDTYSVMIYQEQIIMLSQKLAGFNLQEADSLRKGIGHKDQEKVNKVGKLFLEKCKTYGVIDDNMANVLWDNIRKSGRYIFNASHSMGYAINGYKSAYIKCHFPLEFFASWLGTAIYKGDTYEEVAELVNEAKLFNIDLIKLQDPSRTNYHRVGTKIAFGYKNLKGIGDAQAGRIKEVVSGNDCENWTTFLYKYGDVINASVLEKLLKVGVFCYEKSRAEALHEFNCWHKLSPGDKKTLSQCEQGITHISLLQDLKTIFPKLRKNRVAPVQGVITALENPPYSLVDDPKQIIDMEKELLGYAIAEGKTDGNGSLTCKEMYVGRADKAVLDVVIADMVVKTVKTGKNAGREYANLFVEDDSLQIQAVIYSDCFEKFRKLLYNTAEVILVVNRDKRRDQIIVNEVLEKESRV